MKFVCSHCRAKYQIADDKVGGRTLRMTCRTCGQEILIRGEPQPTPQPLPPPPPAAALGVRSSLSAAARPTPIGVSAPAGARASNLPRATPPPPPSPLGADFRAATAPAAPAATMGPPDEWHVAIDDHPVGPIRREEVARKIAAGALAPDSLAWREGLDDWMPLKDIPELAVLLHQAGHPSSHASSGHASAPAQVTASGAIGGRAGAAPGFVVEDWAPVVAHQSAPPDAAAGQRAGGTLSEADLRALRGGPRMPSVPVMFALAGGLAFMMAVVAILGARFLAKDASVAANPQTAAPIAAHDAPTQPAAAHPSNVIELEEQVLDDATGDDRPKRLSGAPRPAPSGSKKELTDEQKAMLARMGGSNGTDLSGLSRQGTQTAGPARAAGSLTGAELSAVVNRNKKQLQRCYETAARGAASDDTVRLDVNVSIAPSGSVSSVRVGGQGLPGMTECIQRSVKMWRFPSAGNPTDTRFPLLFQPGA